VEGLIWYGVGGETGTDGILADGVELGFVSLSNISSLC
jgi:hypothetical protein